MWLHVPKDIDSVIWEGPLEPELATGRAMERGAAQWAPRTDRDRYDRTGDMADLKRVIEAHEQAVEQAPPGSPELPGYLSNLGVGLTERYARTGNLADLEGAIEALRQAVKETPRGSPDLPMFLSNLGIGLRVRYALTGELADLERAIQVFEQAVERTPEGSPYLPMFLDNLGNGLRDRYARTGELADLERAIEAYEQAVEQTPPGSADLPRHLSNLGSGLSDRYALTGRLFDLEAANRQLPRVSIGQPEVWQLAKVYPPQRMSSMLRAKLEESDFYLVRLACSFRPGRDDGRVEWARFVAHLTPDAGGHQPVAYDLHPLQVTHQVRRNVKVSLAPNLKFMEVEAGVGEVDLGVEYPELQPVITATGAGEPSPSWDYEEAQGLRIQGSKWMHVLVKAPKGMPSGRAVLDLVADVRVRGSLLRMLVLSKNRAAAEARLTVQLWE